MATALNSYQNRRDDLLTQITKMLSNDGRFIAGWLTGSFGRNDSDALSDLDINLVVSEKDSPTLCLRSAQAGTQTSAERYSLFDQFGRLALIHENNNNAPEGGTFTFTLYAGSAIMVDWTLIPQTNALRPFQSEILFDKVGIPTMDASQVELLEQSKKIVAEQWAFFWMMTAVTIKYIIRGDSVFATQWVEHLNGMIQEMERLINRQAWSYTRGSVSQFQPTLEKQIESIRQLCTKMQDLQAKAAKFTGLELSMPLKEIETLLSLVKK
jgi:hypothetical protein